MDEEIVSNQIIREQNVNLIIQIFVALLVVLISVAAYFVRRKFVSGNTLLIVGLSDSGKSVLFLRLLGSKERSPLTYTSFKENKFDSVKLASSKKDFSLVDFPGSERLRKQLFSTHLKKDRKSLKGIIFVVDSSTFSKKSRDVAAFLYDVIYESESLIPICVACNKQDYSLAKSEQAVKTALEREFGLINSTRGSALESTDGESVKRILTDTGKNFQWSDLKIPIEFLPCIADNTDENDRSVCMIDPVESWICNL